MTGKSTRSLYDAEIATDASDGLFARSAYSPEVATVASVGLFKILATPVVAVQSEGT